MSRIAFVLDRIFRKFGLSGKSFIPVLIGTGCGVPGIMASRTIENERDRRMTIMTTTFIPCGAKLPFIAMYFYEAWTTYNDFANLGYLYIDIYAPTREAVPAIRKIIVDTMHEHFNERVRNEGQQQSGVHAVYKYRLEFTPLIST